MIHDVGLKKFQNTIGKQAHENTSFAGDWPA